MGCLGSAAVEAGEHGPAQCRRCQSYMAQLVHLINKCQRLGSVCAEIDPRTSIRDRLDILWREAEMTERIVTVGRPRMATLRLRSARRE